MARSVLASSPSSTSFLEGRIPAVGSQHKRGLLWAVNVAVDKIVSHFSVARNIVQKAQLGDSRINPSVGRLVLCDLCPALYTILSDGLNPYKQDLIMGRRPNTPWSVVEASVKTVPCMKPLYNLYYQLDQISHINSAQKKFNAFIFSLLNLKRLEFWISCLQGCGELLTTHYSPTAFLSLSHTTCSVLFEEFLLLLQPLSVLTFHLDPLFEYHHQPLAERGSLGSHPQPRGQDRKEGQPGKPPPSAGEDSGSGVEQDSSQRKEGVRVGGTAEGAWGQRRARGHQGGQGESGYTLHRTFDQVMQWGDRLAQSLGELAKGPTSPWAAPRPTPLETPTVETAPAGDRRTQGWWNQLSQSSQVYLSSTSGSGRWVKPKARGGKGSSLMDLTKCQSSGPEEGGMVQDPDQRESVMDRTPPIDPTLREEPTQTNPPNRPHSPDQQQDPTPGVQTPSEKPQEGMPVTESRLECRRSEVDRTVSPPARDPLRRGSGSELEGTVRRDSLWLGRLFGARIPSTYSPSEQRPRNSQESHRGRRLPSEWLSLDRKGLQWLQTVIPRPKERPAAPTQINPPSEEIPKAARMVRTLCDHTATADDQLSFGKGAVLEILSCVDEDWIRCRDGDVSGLVPIGYTSLI